MPDKVNYAQEGRDSFGYFHRMDLRWNDLDAYRHLNNARFYTFYDTAIMHYLTVSGGFDLLDGPVVPFTLENLCRYHQSIQFPTRIDCGLRVARIGSSSVRYELGLFAEESAAVAATGYFIDVFVDRGSDKPCPIPPDVRAHLTRIFKPHTSATST